MPKYQTALFPEIDMPAPTCICTRVCNCEDEENGRVSNDCPEHNLNPHPNPECTAIVHWFEISEQRV